MGLRFDDNGQKVERLQQKNHQIFSYGGIYFHIREDE